MTSPHVSVTALRERLLQAFGEQGLEVQDDSHLHAGHAGAKEGGHYTVRMISTRFQGLSRVARHRLVYDALRELMQQGIHALVIDARSPDEC